MSEGQTAEIPPRKSRSKKIFFSLITFIALAVIGEQAWYRYTFPYGWSHCCDIILGGVLQQYAEDHGGRFPSGGDCPEASLSLLYSNYADANLLRGKTVPLATVQQALAVTGKLGKDSCGWHYVDGLTLADDPRIAIVWDKVGLGHNGQMVRGGGHSVIYVSGGRGFVSGAEWPEFLRDQKDLIMHRSKEALECKPGLTARILLPTGEVLTNSSGPYELATSETSQSLSNDGTESGSNLELQWYRLPDEGQVVWTLTLPDKKLRSKPVAFTVRGGSATPACITFEMQNY